MMQQLVIANTFAAGHPRRIAPTKGAGNGAIFAHAPAICLGINAF